MPTRCKRLRLWFLCVPRSEYFACCWARFSRGRFGPRKKRKRLRASELIISEKWKAEKTTFQNDNSKISFLNHGF